MNKLNDVLILGGGVGGTVVANLLAKDLRDRARVTVVDTTGIHVYQPGFLYVAIGQEHPEALQRPEASLLRHDIKLIVDRATHVDTATQKVVLASGRTVRYDELLLA
ncbi:MAG: FAD-dependent oxidoreductase, partial [Isosphaeraceae bacterium]